MNADDSEEDVAITTGERVCSNAAVWSTPVYGAAVQTAHANDLRVTVAFVLFLLSCRGRASRCAVYCRFSEAPWPGSPARTPAARMMCVCASRGLSALVPGLHAGDLTWRREQTLQCITHSRRPCEDQSSSRTQLARPRRRRPVMWVGRLSAHARSQFWVTMPATEGDVRFCRKKPQAASKISSDVVKFSCVTVSL